MGSQRVGHDWATELKAIGERERERMETRKDKKIEKWNI